MWINPFAVIRLAAVMLWLTYFPGQTLAPIFIFLRAITHAVEQGQGMNGKLATSNLTYTLSEGVLIILVGFFLTFCHPAWAIGDDWVEEGWSWKGDRNLSLRQTTKDQLWIQEQVYEETEKDRSYSVSVSVEPIESRSRG